MANTKIKNTVLDSSVISGQSTVTAASGDFVLIQDISDSDNLKKALVSDFGGTPTSIADADADTKIQVEESSDEDVIRFDVGGTEYMTLTSNGKLNVTEIAHISSGSLELGNGDEKQIFDASGETIQFQTADTERLRISGNNLHLNGGTDARVQLGSGGAGANQVDNNTVHIRGDGANMKLMAASGGSYQFEVNGTEIFSSDSSGQSKFTGSGNLLTLNASSGVTYLKFAENGTSRFFLATLNGSDGLAFVDADGGSTRMKIFDDGDVGLGGAETGNIINSSSGVGFYHERGADTIVSRSGGAALSVLRQSSDGELIRFKQAGSQEGSINVSGSSVTLQGFTGVHETSGIADDTAIGTVVSTIDELDTYVSGSKSGQTRAEHPKVKVSDSVGDSRVYGVLQSKTESDDKPLIASVGLGTILVTGACSGGDLLESNGDGTAKVQDDDIIRSKTIGKVTIGDSNTGVKSVSCVLYCG